MKSNYKTIQVASIPDRSKMLEKTIGSLIDQVDCIRVMLNGHKKVPEYLLNGTQSSFISPYHQTEIQVYKLDNSLGDTAKFYPGFQDGYLFTVDDDLIYPPGYIETMVKAIDQWNCIISLHGRKMQPRPVSSSYRSYKKSYRCLAKVTGTHFVDIAGTGVMGFHTDKFVPSITRMKIKNMADIWIAKQAYEKNVSMMVIPHDEDYLIYQNPKNTIWDSRASHVKLQTAIYNSIKTRSKYQ